MVSDESPAAGTAAPTLTDVIKASLDRFEFGYHELSDAEAEAVTIAVYEWLQGHHIDLLEFRG